MYKEEPEEYEVLILVGNNDQICEDETGKRVLVTERNENDHLYHRENGYPLRRSTLEHCANWGVETIHLYTEEADGPTRYDFDIEDYYNAEFEPEFDDEFATVPRTEARP